MNMEEFIDFCIRNKRYIIREGKQQIRKQGEKMDKKIQILLDKLNIGEEYFQYFSDATISKIKVNSKNKS